MMTEEKFPKVGVGVMIFKNGKVLMGKRKSSHGAGEFASPGGHLDFGESFEECAKREVREETGMEIDNIRFQFLSNLRTYTGKHYVHVQLLSDWKRGEPKVMEPEKCEGWAWYDLDDLPEPLFKTYNFLLESLKTGRTFFDA